MTRAPSGVLGNDGRTAAGVPLHDKLTALRQVERAERSQRIADATAGVDDVRKMTPAQFQAFKARLGLTFLRVLPRR